MSSEVAAASSALVESESKDRSGSKGWAEQPVEEAPAASSGVSVCRALLGATKLQKDPSMVEI